MRNMIIRALCGLLLVGTAACGGGDDAPEFKTRREFGVIVGELYCDIQAKCNQLAAGLTVEQCKKNARDGVAAVCDTDAGKAVCDVDISEADKEKLIDCYEDSKDAACGATEAPASCKALGGSMTGT